MTKSLFQWYATVHFSTCEACLRRHGEIFESSADIPPLHEDCRCHILEILSDELEYYREKSDIMKEKGMAELARRRCWSEAVTLLSKNFARAEELFCQAYCFDLYLEEIEALHQRERDWLTVHPEERALLNKLFVRGYRIKFNQDKYQSLAQGMRVSQEQHGIDRIRELFA
jgi:hypothetical protein